jgi:hypothetical protein
MGFVLDVAGYGARSAPAQNAAQRRLPRLVVDTLAECGMDLDSVDHEWTGDGINAVMPADMDPTVVLPVLIRSLAANLGADNARNYDRVRLRMAIGVGLVEQSEAGFGGPMIVDTNRLVGSPPLRSALAAYPVADLAVAISDQVYATVIRPGYPGIPGSQFTRVNVVAKEFKGPAWIWVSARQWSQPAYRPLRPEDPREIGGYRLAGRLGEGPAGRVYLGRREAQGPGGGTGRPGTGPGAGPGTGPGTGPEGGPEGGWLAVKVFLQELAADAGTRRRIATGVLAASVLRGPHIAPVVDSGTDSGRPWVASRLVRGPSLAEIVAETGPLPSVAATWFTLDVARALVALHAAGLAHQAIVPGNTLLEPDGTVLTDFALSRAALAAVPVSLADDMFLLGCAAFFAATGREPWDTCPVALVLAGETASDPDLAGCPPALLPVVTACLEPDKPRRPAAAELVARVSTVAGQRPRSWLPSPVAARFAEYQQLRPPAPAPWAARFRSLRRGVRRRGR